MKDGAAFRQAAKRYVQSNSDQLQKISCFMKRTIILIINIFFLLCSCDTNKTNSNIRNNVTNDSLILVKMVKARENAMKIKDIATVMTQFSDDATFINSQGYYCANKREIEKFHNELTHLDSTGYYYKAGNVHVRILDTKNALVYYPWRMDWFNTSKPNDTLNKEVGLMSLTAQKRNDKWLWVAITNQHTSEYFNDLIKHTDE
jgi:hypothetical protein